MLQMRRDAGESNPRLKPRGYTNTSANSSQGEGAVLEDSSRGAAGSGEDGTIIGVGGGHPMQTLRELQGGGTWWDIMTARHCLSYRQPSKAEPPLRIRDIEVVISYGLSSAGRQSRHLSLTRTRHAAMHAALAHELISSSSSPASSSSSPPASSSGTRSAPPDRRG